MIIGNPTTKPKETPKELIAFGFPYSLSKKWSRIYIVFKEKRGPSLIPSKTLKTNKIKIEPAIGVMVVNIAHKIILQMSPFLYPSLLSNKGVRKKADSPYHNKNTVISPPWRTLLSVRLKVLRKSSLTSITEIFTRSIYAMTININSEKTPAKLHMTPLFVIELLLSFYYEFLVVDPIY